MLNLKVLAVVSALFLGVLAGCAQTTPTPIPPTLTIPPATTEQSPTPSPELTPTKTPLPPSINGAQSAASPMASSGQPDIEGLEAIVERFGFALVPEYLPDGIEASHAIVSGRSAQVVYGDDDAMLLVAFPVDFSPGGDGILTRPSDALVEVEVDNQTGHLMKGGWSNFTIMQGPGIDPADAEWDYDKSLTLFYDYKISGGEAVGIAVQALVNPSMWISEEDMIRIAESLTRIE